MFCKLVDVVMQPLQEKLISRIMHEMICLFEISTMHETANNVTDLVQD